jgi:hypothetical protein
MVYGLFAFLAVIVSILFSANTTKAATFCVGTAVELQAALDAAESNGQNDEIHILQGTYNGNFAYGSTEPYDLTMGGGYADNCTSRIVDPANTVLDAQNNGRVLALNAFGIAVNFTVGGVESHVKWPEQSHDKRP